MAIAKEEAYEEQYNTLDTAEGNKIIYMWQHLYYNSVCRCSQTAGRNSCSIVSENVSNGSYHMTVYPVTNSRLSSA